MADTKDDGGPAFPCEWDYINSNRAAANGMTLRDYFAAKAMQALIARVPYGEHAGIGQGPVSVAAFNFADAMLKARQS